MDDGNLCSWLVFGITLGLLGAGTSLRGDKGPSLISKVPGKRERKKILTSFRGVK